MKYPVYQILDGRLHIQRVEGGRWEVLDKDQQNKILARLNGIDFS